MEKAALIAKEALLREVGEKSKDPAMAAVEEELLEKINNMGMGLGSRRQDLCSCCAYKHLPCPYSQLACSS